MKIVNKKEILDLPPGTVYKEVYGYRDYSSLMVKKATVGGDDFLCTELLDIPAETDQQQETIFEALKENNISVSAEDFEYIDGKPMSALYLVYDDLDVKHLVNKLQVCFKPQEPTRPQPGGLY